MHTFEELADLSSTDQYMRSVAYYALRMKEVSGLQKSSKEFSLST